MRCSVEGCQSDVKYKGLCGKHYKRQWRHGDPRKTLLTMHEGAKCSVLTCDNPAAKTGLCKLCYNQKWRTGSTDLHRAPNGKGRPLTADGYVLLTVNGKRVYEHIHKAELALGKPLPSKAIVHHVDEDRSHNENTNLVVCPDQAYHMLIHKRMRDLGISFKGVSRE